MQLLFIYNRESRNHFFNLHQILCSALSTAQLRSHHLNVSRRSAASQYWSMQASGQNSIPTLPFYSALKYMVPSMLGLAALKYQGKEEGLFEENPVPTWCFLGATFAYSLVIGTMKLQMTTSHNGIWFQMLNRAAIALGLVLPVSLLSIFLPHRISFWLLLILTPLPVVVLAWPVLLPAYNWVAQIQAKVVIHIIWYWLYTTIVTNVVENIRRAKVVCWASGRQESLPK